MTTNTAIYIEIDLGEYQPTIHRLSFATKEAAMAQLDLLEPMIGLGKFRNDPEKNRHRIVCEDGEMIVVVEHIRSARVIDQAVFDTQSTYCKVMAEDANAKLAQNIAKAVVVAHQTLVGSPVKD